MDPDVEWAIAPAASGALAPTWILQGIATGW